MEGRGGEEGIINSYLLEVLGRRLKV